MAEKCGRNIGCHDCLLVKEDLRIFRQAIVQFLIEPSTRIAELKMMALSLKGKIDRWYEPHTENYSEED